MEKVPQGAKDIETDDKAEIDKAVSSLPESGERVLVKDVEEGQGRIFIERKYDLKELSNPNKAEGIKKYVIRVELGGFEILPVSADESNVREKLEKLADKLPMLGNAYLEFYRALQKE